MVSPGNVASRLAPSVLTEHDELLNVALARRISDCFGALGVQAIQNVLRTQRFHGGFVQHIYDVG